ncbi:MAG TPA: AAA family ATPase, partial [Dehalococcoidia bacterium]|nr:AAA family ATPase [Dehalococcoidia bacterium]
MTTRIQRPLISPVLIERDRELEAIAECLERAETGLHTVTIAGEAGLGKTRLGREAAALATQRGWLALEAGCAESDRVLELAPVRDLLHQLVAASSPEDVGRYLGSEANELVALFPELADHEEPAPTVAVPAEGRQHLFRALVRFLIRVSRSHPLLLLMEDIHWSDESTLELLLCLARMARSERILVLATYRSDSVGEGLAHFLAELDRERVATELSLGRLTRSGVASMVKAVLSWDRPAPTALLDRLYTLTEGNPFFIEEVLKVLTMQGEVASEERVRELSVEVPTIPRTVQATIEARIALLSPGARRVLLWAATIGRRFDFAFLSVLEGIQEEQLLAVLRELVAAQLIVEVSADRFALRHALIGEAVQARMLRRERRHLHLRVADAMERFYAEDLDQHLADVAEHYYRAQAWSKVLEYAQRLGSRAQALHAPRAAIDCFTRALEAARHLRASEPLALYRARGRAYEAAGEFDAARQDLERALNVSRMTDDQAGAWQSLIDLGLLWCARDYDRAGDYFRSALDLARELGDPARLGHSLNRLGNWHMNREEMGEALRRHEEALHIFRNCGDQRGTAETLDLLGMTACISGDSSRGRSYYEEAISLFREMDDRLGLASALATMSGFGGTYETDTVVPRMRSAEAVRAGEEAVRVAGEINWRSGEAYAQLELAFCLGSVGEYARAFELGHAALALSDEIGHQQWLSGAHAALGALYLDVLSAPAAREHLEQALAVATE